MRTLAPGSAAGALSLVVPGLGHLATGRRERGFAALGLALSAVAVLLWLGWPPAWAALVPFWLAVAADASGRRMSLGRLALLGALPIYVVAWQATEIAPTRLVEGYPQVRPLFRGLLSPDFVTTATAEIAAEVRVDTPCTDASGPPAELDASAPSLSARPACVSLGEALVVEGAGFPPGSVAEITVRNPSSQARVGTAVVDEDGRLRAEVVVPVEAVPEYYRSGDTTQRLRATVAGPIGPLRPSDTMLLILEHIGVTIALGLMATLFGAVLAVPLAVLGARNLMGTNRFTLTTYGAARLVMNVLRSIEPLILAVVFVVWVKQGPFAGALALTLHSVAALGKLFSEAIESIDPGPIEAVRATGAGWLQTVVYAVLPQVLPPFTAFTVYRWDINVRMSTIIGYVGGGGIGFLLKQWISKRHWGEAATAIVVIAVVVMVLDFTSAVARERIVSGRPLIRPRWRPLAYAALVALAVWGWRTSEIDPRALVAGAPKIRAISSQLLRPDLVARGVLTETARAALVVPCGLAIDDPAVLEAVARDGPGVALGERCAAVGDEVPVTGTGFEAGARGQLYWLLPDGRRLRVAPPSGRVVVGADGAFETRVEARPLLAAQGAASAAPMFLAAELTREVGGLRPSPALTTSLDLLVETILMALLATTGGGLIAVPLSLLAARNIMPRNALGNGVYYATRTGLNLLRSVEPIILAVVFAAWVGQGSPFPGVLAILLVTVANLGKLFSEALENIEPGPIEAVRATGASRAQVVAYGVLPQIIPPYLAFGMYQWDINVRISTVIGFVGGGAIGFKLQEWMNSSQWRQAAVAILGIVVVVSLIDYASARMRERLA